MGRFSARKTNDRRPPAWPDLQKSTRTPGASLYSKSGPQARPSNTAPAPVVNFSRQPGPPESSREPFSGRRLRSEEHTSELQSPDHLVCRLLLEKKKKKLASYNGITTRVSTPGTPITSREVERQQIAASDNLGPSSHHSLTLLCDDIVRYRNRVR